MDGGVFTGAWGECSRNWRRGVEAGVGGVEGGAWAGEGEIGAVGGILRGGGGVGEEWTIAWVDGDGVDRVIDVV